MPDRKTIISSLKILVLLIALFLIIQKAWVGEDAFISFRYVDNLIHGNGLVYNVGERVEGFTHPLWILILTIFRIAGFELRPLAIFLGTSLTLTSIALLLFLDNNKKVFLPIGVLLLVGNSAFQDFSTSGFETSLSYLLIVIIALVIKKHGILGRPLIVGTLATLLLLNRPETILVFLYIAFFHLKEELTNLWFKKYSFFSSLKNRSFFRFIFPFVLGAIPYQIFRMGYYADILPNTFYAKRGGEFYITQGINYLKDFAITYGAHWIVVFFIILLFIEYSVNKNLRLFKSRVHLSAMSLLLMLYVLYAGGDYMHGRFLILSFLFLAIALNDILDRFSFFEKHFGTQLLICVLILAIALWQTPISTIAEKPINQIKDERYFFNSHKEINLEYLTQSITREFGWAERGLYYKELANALGQKITVNMPNIGLFGYAAGDKVNVIGVNLIDRYLARLPIAKRGTIAHEGSDWEMHNLFKKANFSNTPYELWTKPAQEVYSSARYSYIINKSQNNDSSLPTFNLEDKNFYVKFSNLVKKDIKKSIDESIKSYLQSLNDDSINSDLFNKRELIGFLEYFWYPMANNENRQLLVSLKKKYFQEEFISKYDFYNFKIKPEADLYQLTATRPLSVKTFLENMIFAGSIPFRKKWNNQSLLDFSTKNIHDFVNYKIKNIQFENIDYDYPQYNFFFVEDGSKDGIFRIKITKPSYDSPKYYMRIVFRADKPGNSVSVVFPEENGLRRVFTYDTTINKVSVESKEIFIDVTDRIKQNKEIQIRISDSAGPTRFEAAVEEIEIL